MERNRISSLQSHGKPLEKECCLPSVFCDSGNTPANLLCELNGHLMPCTSCFYGKWVEDNAGVAGYQIRPEGQEGEDTASKRQGREGGKGKDTHRHLTALCPGLPG